jgi:mannose-1-phosphate guanylyltransferase / mannose-6-phosphate isomerase
MWPESSESLPKQFIPLIGQRSTFQSIVTVVADPDVFGPVVVVTNFDDRFRRRGAIEGDGRGGGDPARAGPA